MPANTAQDVYTQIVLALPLSERLRLAALILEELSSTGVAIVETKDSWSEQDEKDLATFSLQYAESLYPEPEDLV